MTEAKRSEGRVVVGVDGSASAAAALEWAARQAQLTGSELDALTAWEWPKSYGFATPVPEGYQPEQEARRILEKAIAGVRERYPDLTIKASVCEGYPIQTLLEASRDADLLVVGSRGHGELAGMLIGSVSGYCVAHAKCPVTVIKAKSD